MITLINISLFLGFLAAVAFVFMLKTGRLHLHYHPRHAPEGRLKYWGELIGKTSPVALTSIANAYANAYRPSSWHLFYFFFLVIFYIYVQRVFRKLRKDHERVHGKDEHAGTISLNEGLSLIGWTIIIVGFYWIYPSTEIFWHWITRCLWEFWVWLSHGREGAHSH